MRVNRHGFGLAPGEFNAELQARLDRDFPEKMYFGWANFGPFDRPMTVGLFGTPATYNWFKQTFGRAPRAAFNNPLFDTKPVEAGQEPRYSAIVQALRAIDADLANYQGPIRNMSAGPAVSFEPDSPAYVGIDTATLVFNTPDGPLTVVNGVPINTGLAPGTKTKTEAAGSVPMLWVGVGLAGLAAVLLLSKGN